MKEEIFKEVYKHYLANYSLGDTLETLATKYGYINGEHLRSAFKAERKKRHIPSKVLAVKNERNIVVRKEPDRPRVAICDVETLPGVAYFWRLYDDNIGIEQVVSDSCMLGWAGKFLNEPTIFSDILTPQEAVDKDTSRIARSCWDFLSQADIVIGHNFKDFDSRIINTAFLQHNIAPLKFIIVDTLQIARQNFKFDSNKLEFICKKLGIRNKMDNSGFPLWKACHEGDTESLEIMHQYNIGDILSNEELFYKFRPYVRNINLALYNEIVSLQCPVCGSSNLYVEGNYYTSAGKWDSIRCLDCKCLSRGKTNLFTAEKKKSLLINS